jgi:UDP-N-acetylmuramate--alanine ligase
VSSERLARAIAEHGHHRVRYVPERADIAEQLAREARKGDVIIALGAGDINRILPDVAARIAARAGAPEKPV